MITKLVIDYNTLHDAALFADMSKQSSTLPSALLSVRSALTNVHVKWDAKKATVEAMDGYVSYRRQNVPISVRGSKAGDILIPAELICKLPRPFKTRMNTNVIIEKNENSLKIYVDFAQVEFFVKTDETVFPNLDSLWPQEHVLQPEDVLQMNPALILKVAKMRGSALKNRGGFLKTQPMKLVHATTPDKPIIWEVPYTNNLKVPAHILMMLVRTPG